MIDRFNFFTGAIIETRAARSKVADGLLPLPPQDLNQLDCNLTEITTNLTPLNLAADFLAQNKTITHAVPADLHNLDTVLLYHFVGCVHSAFVCTHGPLVI